MKGRVKVTVQLARIDALAPAPRALARTHLGVRRKPNPPII
ncbi:hypothetical protein U91I_00619 [alpha proteobacterium U9-1i]|nr:hypothetical protein U91I_00619 [alpha proteobacterium U9-1i]